MHPRLRLVLLTVLAVALGGGVGLAGAMLSDRSDEPRAAASGGGFEGSLMPPGVQAPEFALRDEDGRVVRMGDLRGRPVIVTFLYTSCEESCPLQAQQIRGALDDLADDGVEVPAIAVSVDPERDTAARARRFLVEQGAYGRIRFVLGSREALEPVWRGFAIQPQLPEAEHQARVTLVDGRGRQRVGYPVSLLTPEALAHDVRALLAEQDDATPAG